MICSVEAAAKKPPGLLKMSNGCDEDVTPVTILFDPGWPVSVLAKVDSLREALIAGETHTTGHKILFVIIPEPNQRLPCILV